MQKIIFVYIFSILFTNQIYACPGDGDCTPSNKNKNTSNSIKSNDSETANDTKIEIGNDPDNNSSFSMQIKPGEKNFLKYIKDKSILEKTKKEKLWKLDKIRQKILSNYNSDKSYEIEYQLNNIQEFIEKNKRLSIEDKNQITNKIININNSIISYYTNEDVTLRSNISKAKIDENKASSLSKEYFEINDIVKTLEVLDPKKRENENIFGNLFFKNNYSDIDDMISDYRSQLSSNLIKINQNSDQNFNYIYQNDNLKNKLEQLEYVRKLEEIMR